MNPPENLFGYSALVWQAFSQPQRSGDFAAGEIGVLSVQAVGAAAKSLLRLAVKLENGTIADARFKAYGCPSTIAVGEWLTQQVIGKSAEALRSAAFSAPAIRQALEIAEDRAHCALMGEDVLKSLLQQM